MFFNQFFTFIAKNDILEKFQSGFRVQHSTESVLLKVSNNLLLTVESGKCAVLILLDFSAPFDTLDHAILLDHLKCGVGIQGTVLKWFASYLKDKTFSMRIGNFSFSSAVITSCIP